LSNTFTWIVQTATGIHYYVDLSLTIVTTWLVDVAHSLYVPYATRGFVVAIAVAFMCVAIGVGIVFKKKGENNVRR